MICKNCNKEFKKKNNRQQFCSRSCAAKYNNKARNESGWKPKPHSDEAKAKMLDAANKYWNEHPELKRKKEIRSQKGKHKKPKSILELSKRTISKICRRLNIGCSNCGWNEEICDIHHIIPRREGGIDDHINLTYLCPNCHRLADRKKLIKLTNLQEYIGEEWKEYYYG